MSWICPTSADFRRRTSRRLPGVLRTRCLSESRTTAQGPGGSFRLRNPAVPERVSRVVCTHGSVSSRDAKLSRSLRVIRGLSERLQHLSCFLIHMQAVLH